MPDDIDNQPQQRRAVFLRGIRRLMEPIADYLEQRLEVPVSLPVTRSVLRPPGALAEKPFLDTCYRCGNCVDVCPARAIRPTSSGDVERAGTPCIDPDLSACVICDELSCMKACPSGALRLVSDVSQIRMGLALVDAGTCVRTHGENCTHCVDKCPLGVSAIALGEGGEVVVRNPGCVGCGVCQFYCPTLPKAIRVEPL